MWPLLPGLCWSGSGWTTGRSSTGSCGLKARPCDDIDSLDGYLPPQVAALARKVAEVLEVPELDAT